MIDWLRLRDLREHRRGRALEVMLADRRTADASVGAVQAAQGALGQAENAKTRHWRAAAADPGLDIASLAAAAAWSRVLDGAIAREHSAVDEAEANARACARALARSREALIRAAGGVEKAGRLSESALSLGRWREDARLEEVAEDVAAARWAARATREG